jgi:hypothetical protein
VAGIIQCGSITTGASGSLSATLGWQPQFILLKRSDSTQSWHMVDAARGSFSGATLALHPNTSGAEENFGDITVSSTGFASAAGNFSSTSGETFVYMAIRAP